MRNICVAIAVSILLISVACGSTRKIKAADVSGERVVEMSESVRVYRADYDSTFRMALDALRRINGGSAKFVKHREGLIVFRKPEDSGTITVNVQRIDNQRTAVEISAKNSRKYWLDSADKETRTDFFEELDKLLGVVPAEPDSADAHASEQPGEAEAGAVTANDKNILVEEIRRKLQLGEAEDFLGALSYEDLTLLDAKLERFVSPSNEDAGLVSKCSTCYIDLARLYHDDAQYDRSAEALKLAISIDPDNAVAHCNLGETFKHMGRYEEAVLELEEARRIDPTFPDTFINLGIIYDDYLIDDQKALENYREYLKMGGRDKQVLEWIAVIEKQS